MGVIKNWLLLLFFGVPIFAFSQVGIYPKDTIYVKYEQKKGDYKWNAKFEGNYRNKPGIYFNVETGKGDMALFYPYSEKADTLCIKHLKDYNFSDIEEINKKRNKWIFDHKRPPANRNGVFQTYLIEVISEYKFVKYPVIWRNERI